MSSNPFAALDEDAPRAPAASASKPTDASKPASGSKGARDSTRAGGRGDENNFLQSFARDGTRFSRARRTRVGRSNANPNRGSETPPAQQTDLCTPLSFKQLPRPLKVTAVTSLSLRRRLVNSKAKLSASKAAKASTRKAAAVIIKVTPAPRAAVAAKAAKAVNALDVNLIVVTPLVEVTMVTVAVLVKATGEKLVMSLPKSTLLLLTKAKLSPRLRKIPPCSPLPKLKRSRLKRELLLPANGKNLKRRFSMVLPLKDSSSSPTKLVKSKA